MGKQSRHREGHAESHEAGDHEAGDHEVVTFTFLAAPHSPRQALPEPDCATPLRGLPLGRVSSPPFPEHLARPGEIRLLLRRDAAGRLELGAWTFPTVSWDLGGGRVVAGMPDPDAGCVRDVFTGVRIVSPIQAPDPDDGWQFRTVDFWRASGLLRPLGHGRWVQIEVDDLRARGAV